MSEANPIAKLGNSPVSVEDVPQVQETPTQDNAQNEMTRYERSLRAHGRLSEIPGQLRPGQTHVIERNAQGEKVIRRKRFSAV